MTSIKTAYPINWNSVSSRIAVFPLLKDKNITITGEFANNLWPKTKDIILKNTIISSEKGQINLDGEFKNKKLSLIVAPFKIDLIISPKEQVDLMSFSLMTIGSYSEAINDINQLAEFWLMQENFPQIQRLAFALELISRVETNDDAYHIISQYLHFPIDSKTSSDFRYQINKFTTSEVIKGLKINRLTSLDALKLSVRFPIEKISQTYYSHLNLDINTDSEFQGELKKDVIFQLYQELVLYADKIIRR